MNTLHPNKSLITTLLTLLLSVVIIGCSSSPKITYQPTTAYAVHTYCTDETVNGRLSIPNSTSAILADKNRTKDAEFITAMLQKSALEIAQASGSIENCLTTLDQGQAIFQKALSANRAQVAKRSGYQPSSDASIATIQRTITDMWADDQSARITMLNLGTEDTTGARFWALQLAKAHTIEADLASTEYIENLLDTYDWLDRKRFGAAVSQHAWLLVQHADDRPDLQARVLKNMETHLKTGGIKPANYAYLWDRVAVNTGRKQRYGTQPIWECQNSQLQLQPLENPETVNQRRAEMNMDTVEQGLANMARSVCQK